MTLKWFRTATEQGEEYSASTDYVEYSVFCDYWEGIRCEASIDYYVFWSISAESAEQGKLKCEEFNSRLLIQIIKDYIESRDALSELK